MDAPKSKINQKRSEAKLPTFGISSSSRGTKPFFRLKQPLDLFFLGGVGVYVVIKTKMPQNDDSTEVEDGEAD